MPPATPHSTATTSTTPTSTATTTNHRQLNPNPTSKTDLKISTNKTPNSRSIIISDMPDPNNNNNSSPIKIEGHEEDTMLANSKFLHRMEVLKRRHRRTKQLQRIYRDCYWALIEEVKFKHREYCWKYGMSAFQEDEDHKSKGGTGVAGDAPTGENDGSNSGGNGCEVHNCKSKAMALTRFCHMHILSDSKQKLYKACNFSIKSSPTGPIRCEKPILRSTVPSYCSSHFQKAEKHVTRALKKAGLNVSNTSKLAPKFHVIVAEYVSQIQNRRKAAQKAASENAEVKEENSS